MSGGEDSSERTQTEAAVARMPFFDREVEEKMRL